MRQQQVTVKQAKFAGFFGKEALLRRKPRRQGRLSEVGMGARAILAADCHWRRDKPSRMREEVAEWKLRKTGGRLLMVTERRDDVVQLLKRDKAATMAKLVLIDGHRQLVDFFPWGVVRVSKLPTLEAAGPCARRHLATVPNRCRLLLQYLFHYDTPEWAISPENLSPPQGIGKYISAEKPPLGGCRFQEFR
jgi:hypothetical protein